MFFKLFRKEVRGLNSMFTGHFIEVKAFYAWQFNRVPCVNFIGELDISKAYNHISGRFQHSIVNVYQHSWYNHNEGKMLFNNTIFVLNDDRMIELANDYSMILFTPHQYSWARQLVMELVDFKVITTAPATKVMGFARAPEAN